MRRLAAALAAALALAGCGAGAGSGGGDVSLLITRDFGATEIGSAEATGVPEGETVMRLLQRRFDVETRYGGGFVQSIDGLSGGNESDWFYYVNGVEADEGAAAHELHDGDRVWWDFHDWGTAMRVPAVVGSFPEPFKSGIEGKRVPVRLECVDPESRECAEVAKRLEAADVTVAAKANVGTPSGKSTLRLVVGPWADIRVDRALLGIERGPAASGVFARFDEAGGRLDLLAPDGEVDRTIRGGLVAAVTYEDQAPTWVVTGTDQAGVASAASALDEAVLAQRFAVAVEDGRSVALPVRPLLER